MRPLPGARWGAANKGEVAPVEIGTLVAFLKADSSEFDSTLDSAGAKMSSTGDQVGSSSGSMADKVDRNFGKITTAGVAAGGALEGFARSQAPLTEGLGRVAQSTGIAQDELRGLAKETSNVTFPLDEAIGLMEMGAQQGLESADALQQYATFWDTVGDATGENSQQLAKAGVGLRAVGVAAGDEQEALAAFGYVTESTSGNVNDLLKFLERTGPQLQEMGMDVNDSAAMLGVLENEFGMTGRTARSEFRKAVNDSDGDMNKMLDTLGVSQEQLATYRGEVESSGGAIQGLADNHAESYTWIEKLKHGVDEALFSLGGYGDAAAALALPLMALGPISKAVVTAFRLMGNGALVNGAKMAAGWIMAMGPIGWVIAAVVGLVALIIANWDTVKSWTIAAWDAVSGAVADGIDWAAQKVDQGVALARGALMWFQALPGLALAWFGGLAAAAGAKINEAVGFVGSLPGRALSALGNLGGFLVGAGHSLIMGFWNGIRNAFAWVKGQVSNLLGSLRNLLPFSPAKEGPFSGAGYTDRSGKALMQDFAKGITSEEGHVVGALESTLGAGQKRLRGAKIGGRVRGGDGADAEAMYAAVRDALDGSRMSIDGRGTARLVNRRNRSDRRRGGGLAPAMR